MFLDKPLRIALLLSTVFHMAIFLPLLHFTDSSIREPQTPLKITYLIPKKVSPVKEVIRQAKKNNVPQQPKMADIGIEQKDKVAEEKIEIPPELPKEKEQLYLSYYRSIREKIRRFVVESYPRFIACGEVRLYFVLSPDGKLREIKVIEEKSSRNQELKEIAKVSVQAAAPFSPFPEELNQQQLSFNVVISFELEN